MECVLKASTHGPVVCVRVRAWDTVRIYIFKYTVLYNLYQCTHPNTRARAHTHTHTRVARHVCPPCPSARPHAGTQARKNTHTRTHAQHANAHACTPSHTVHTRPHAHPFRTHAHAHTHTHPLARAREHTHAHTFAFIHTHTPSQKVSNSFIQVKYLNEICI